MKMNFHFDPAQQQQAKDFLQLVLEAPVEQIGLLQADAIKQWRVNNQITVVTKAQEIIKLRDGKTRKIPLKILVDLLEQACLEENKSLQDRWASLLANTVVINSQVNTTLYSHILGQLSQEDAALFDLICTMSTKTNKYEEGQVMTKIIAAQFVYIQKEDLHKTSQNAHIAIDNLIRLRLLREPTNLRMDGDHILMTDLGFRFMGAVSSW
jgi:hypothetical protein